MKQTFQKFLLWIDRGIKYRKLKGVKTLYYQGFENHSHRSKKLYLKFNRFPVLEFVTLNLDSIKS